MTLPLMIVGPMSTLSGPTLGGTNVRVERRGRGGRRSRGRSRGPPGQRRRAGTRRRRAAAAKGVRVGIVRSYGPPVPAPTMAPPPVVVIVVPVKMFPVPTVITVGPMTADRPPTLGPTKLRPAARSEGGQAGRREGERGEMVRRHGEVESGGQGGQGGRALALATGARTPIAPRRRPPRDASGLNSC